MENKKYSGVWIPKEVLDIGIKNGNERILFAMIIYLSSKEPCTASNRYLSKLLGLSQGHISRLVSRLEVQGFVKIFIDASKGNKRSISINKNMYTLYTNKNIGVGNNVSTLYAKTSINNIDNNKKIIKRENDLSHFDFLNKHFKEDVKKVFSIFRLNNQQKTNCIYKFNFKIFNRDVNVRDFEIYVSNWKNNLKTSISDEVPLMNLPQMRRITFD